jgi:catechol 2,3-dioxygenase-like lactoylglutathione lyase family enzyme
MSQAFDRAIEDIGNIAALEHVNVSVPDQRLATLFYVVGLGFTRDPYLQVGDENMWVNLGRQQFHLPTCEPQVLRGHVGIVVPDLDALRTRLSSVREKLAKTRFSVTEEDGCVVATSPWGNQLRCYASQPRFGDMRLGMPYVEFTVKRGAAAGIARFYEAAFGVKVRLTPDKACATVPAGRDQTLVFRETAAEIPAYDGHHIAVYAADFSGPHGFLKQHDLITEESDAHQYRFDGIFDLESGAKLFEIEHEVRSLKHPMAGRTFVNRNPAQTQRNYVRGRDAYWG